MRAPISMADPALADGWDDWTTWTFVEDRATRWPDNLALKFENGNLSYADLASQSARLSAGLAEIGVKCGDQVAVMLPNCPEFVLLWFAITRLGAVTVPINTAQRSQLLNHILRTSQARYLFISGALMRQFAEATAPPCEPLPDLLGTIVVGDVEFAQMMAANSGVPAHRPRPEDMTAIYFSSGTSGPAKGVAMCHTHMFVKALSTIDMFRMTGEDVLYSTLPLFHSLACCRGVLATLVVGGKDVIRPRFSAGTFWSEVAACGATLGHCVFSMIPILLAQPPSQLDRSHRLRAMYMSRGSELFEDRFGVKLIEPYGSTETDAVTYCRYDEQREGSCGLESPFYEVAILDEHDKPCSVGTIGEISVRSRYPWTLLLGYFGMPQFTVSAFRNLWFHTGDVGWRDSSGYFHFSDKKSDSIRRRGENISSWEVESTVNGHPAVLESAAIAVPTDMAENEVMLCVVLRSGEQVTEAALAEWCAERMPNYMLPRYFEILESLPKTENERIMKYALRNRGKGGVTSETWDRLAAPAAETG